MYTHFSFRLVKNNLHKIFDSILTPTATCIADLYLLIVPQSLSLMDEDTHHYALVVIFFYDCRVVQIYPPYQIHLGTFL